MRLCRHPCGKALPYRRMRSCIRGCASGSTRGRASRVERGPQVRQSLTARMAAEPHKSADFIASAEVTRHRSFLLHEITRNNTNVYQALTILMSNNASPAVDPQQAALQALFRVIASRNRPMTSRLLAKSPELARLAITIGATREAAVDWYFKEINHYAYAGDTPLHIAAAAYQRDIAEELVSKGANVSARNRRGAEPLHYASDGVPGSVAWDPDAQYAVVEFLIRPAQIRIRKTRVVWRPCIAPCEHVAPPLFGRCSQTGLMPLGGTRAVRRPCIWRFRIRDAAAAAPRLRVKNRRKSSDSFSPTALALRTKTPPANQSRIASRPTGSRNSRRG